jgi:alkanesulfonate monooxygenase SsuD/methylene tetrahydromethanopterin reductase-like flavin-dependent oxidoreductase (luciferase family)
MPVEFIGMIGTKDESEIRLSAGPVIDPDYVRRFARAHEDAGFDRVLIGYSSTRPDGTQVAAYAAGQTERLSFLVADAIDYGRYLLPLVREEVARRDSEQRAAAAGVPA